LRTHRRLTVLKRFSASAAAIAATVGVAGCATSYDPGLYSAGGHLQARIYQPASGALQFAVSQPAYAAVFAIVPGRGTALLYPSTPGEAQRQLSPGTHSYAGSSLSYNWWAYAGGVGSYYGTSSAGPTTLVLIASATPLHVNRLMRRPLLLGDLRLTSFYAYASEHAVGRLAELIIPDPANTDWTYDTYTIWPDEQGRRIAAYRVRCPDGRVVIVRGVYPVWCREAGQTPPSQPADTSAGPQSDTGRVNPPKLPRRPLEPTRRKSGGSVEGNSGRVEAGASLRPRGGETRASQPRVRASEPRARGPQTRSAPARRVQPAPSRERQQAAPARQSPSQKFERSDRSRRGRPVS
jgi:hypothetical protein